MPERGEEREAFPPEQENNDVIENENDMASVPAEAHEQESKHMIKG